MARMEMDYKSIRFIYKVEGRFPDSLAEEPIRSDSALLKRVL